MKRTIKIFGLLIFGLLFFAFHGAAQKAFTNSGVSLSSSGTTYDSLTAKGKASSIAIHAYVTKTSGTVAGSLSLEGSNDGLVYSALSSTTLTLTDVATQGIIWNVGVPPVPYYRVKIVNTTGTWVPTVTAVIR